jgi:hypothetical protein
VYASVSEIGEAENISKSYVSRILRLALLAPDIIDTILDGRSGQALMLERLERPLPASWTEQHQLLLGETSTCCEISGQPPHQEPPLRASV